jgi:hypothetical protein
MGAIEVTSINTTDWSGIRVKVRRANGDTVWITGDFRWEVEHVRRHLMKAARRSRLRMIEIAEIVGLAETPPSEEEEYVTAQLAVVEIESQDLPSLGLVPEPEDFVDLEVALKCWQRDVIRCKELSDDSSLETIVAIAANQYRWARFWVERHPSESAREMFAAALSEVEPLRAKSKEAADRAIARRRLAQ